MDDTPTRERVRLQHRAGTFVEMHPNGDEVHKIYGNGYEIVLKDKNVLIKGVCNITIQGDSVLNVSGDAYTNVDGNAYQTIKGNAKQLINGTCEQTVEGDFDINSKGNLTITAENVNINSDVTVRGDIGSTQDISAVGNITASSFFARVSIITSGFITAATYIYGTIVRDIGGSLSGLRASYNVHKHPPKVWTPPVPPAGGV